MAFIFTGQRTLLLPIIDSIHHTNLFWSLVVWAFGSPHLSFLSFPVAGLFLGTCD